MQISGDDGSLALFAEDFVAQPDSYLAAVDADFHVAAITEMARVARSEVLIHPVGARDGHDIDDFTAAVAQRLSAAGLHTETFPAPGTWLRGASTMRITT